MQILQDQLAITLQTLKGIAMNSKSMYVKPIPGYCWLMGQDSFRMGQSVCDHLLSCHLDTNLAESLVYHQSSKE